MRHRVVVGRKSFGRSYNHKKAVLKNLIFSLIKYGRIKTTLAKAKELRRHADRLITLGKRADLNSHRLLLSRYPNKPLISDVLNKLAPKFTDRDGGYTRIVKCNNRMGDNAAMAFIEWVESDLILTKDQKKELNKKKRKKIGPTQTQKTQPDVKKDTVTRDEIKKDKVKEDTPKPISKEVSAKPQSWSSYLLEKIKRYWIAALVFLIVLIAVGLFVRSCQEESVNATPLSQLEEFGASDFKLPDVTNGQLTSLSEFRGSITIVNFWATWCSPCAEEFGSMLKLVDKFQGQVKILAISIDENKKDIVNFMKAFEVSTPDLIVLQDLGQNLAKKWGTKMLPESYILNRDHKLIKKVASTADWSSPSVFHYFSSLL